MAINITKKDISWGYLGTIMTMGSNLFLLPFVLNRLPEIELGLWYTFIAVGSIANLFDFGFKATMARNITYAWSGAETLKKSGAVILEESKETNYELLTTVMDASKKIYLVISGVAGLLLITIGSAYILHISDGIEVKKVVFSWGIYAIAIFFNLYYGYLNAFLAGVGAIAESNKANSIGRIVQLFVAFLLIMCGLGIEAVSIGYLTYCIVFRILAKRYFYNYDGVGNNLKKNHKKASFSEIREIIGVVWHNAWRDGLVTFSAYLNGQASTVLCSWFLSLEDTAVYGLSMQLVNAIVSVSCVYFSTYQAKMQSTYITGEYEKTKKIFSRAVVMFYLIYCIGAICLCTVGIPVLSIIKSNTKLNLPILICLLIYMIFYKNQALCASYIAGTNRIPYMRAYLFSGIAVVFFEVILFMFIPCGIWCLVIVPIVIESMYNYWKWPRFILAEFNMKWIDVLRYGINELKSICGKREEEYL